MITRKAFKLFLEKHNIPYNYNNLMDKDEDDIYIYFKNIKELNVNNNHSAIYIDFYSKQGDDTSFFYEPFAKNYTSKKPDYWDEYSYLSYGAVYVPMLPNDEYFELDGLMDYYIKHNGKVNVFNYTDFQAIPVNTIEQLEEAYNVLKDRINLLNGLFNDVSFKQCMETYMNNVNTIKSLKESNKKLSEKIQKTLKKKSEILDI